MATGIINASDLNFRSTADGSTRRNIIKTLPRGTAVEILGQQGEWLKVMVGGQAGFVSANFVRQEQDAPPVEAQPAAPASGGAATAVAPVTPSAAGAPLEGSCRFNGNSACAPDGTVFARKFRLGVFNNGATSISRFVKDNGARFAGVAPSRLRVMQAVSANEGNLEAINTWDNAFLTFGVFQWTAGAGDGPGEMPSMLSRVKQADAGVFQKFFGKFGLDVTLAPSQPGTPPGGFFVLNGVTLRTAALKERLRTLDWAYRFSLSGRDDTVRQAQIEHAMGRVDLFYRNSRNRIGDRFIGDYVTSEFGVALILDQHVNRPGHVPGTISRAVTKLVAQLGEDDPQGWGDAEERRLLDIYLQLREQTSMTDSTKRADKIRDAVAQGLASDRRGSYQV